MNKPEKNKEEAKEERLEIPVPENQCESCAMALRRFIGNIKGVSSIEISDGKLSITFDGGKISQAELFRISKDSLEKIGHPI
jgi:copper chaperone CopZ